MDSVILCDDKGVFDSRLLFLILIIVCREMSKGVTLLRDHDVANCSDDQALNKDSINNL